MKVKIFILLVLSFLVLNTNNMNLISNINDNENLNSVEIEKHEFTSLNKIDQYSAHNPIDIVGDSDFALKATVEGWSGDGSMANPYRITSLYIEDAPVNAVNITNTTVHFEFENIIIENSNKHGFYLVDVINGKFSNIQLINNSNTGMYLSNVNKTVFENVISYSNTYGLYFYFSYDNVIRNLTSSFEISSIRIYYSMDNQMSDILAYNNTYGIYFYRYGHNNILSKSEFYNNSYGVYLYMTNDQNIISEVISNENNYGYYMVQDNRNNIVKNSSFKNNKFRGLDLGFVNRNYTVINNIIENNAYGVYSASSYYSVVKNNIIQNNDNWGLYLIVRNSTVENNIVRNNEKQDIWLYGEHTVFLSNQKNNYLDVQQINGTVFSFYQNALIHIRWNEYYLNTELNYVELHNNSYISSGSINTTLDQTILLSTSNLDVGVHEVQLRFQETTDFHKFYIKIMASPSPVLSSPADISFVQGSTNNVISWSIEDPNPANYIISLNGGILDEGVWQSGDPITINLDFLPLGFYVVNIRVYNEFGTYSSDSVVVTVVFGSETSSGTSTGVNNTAGNPSDIQYHDVALGLLGGFVLFGALFVGTKVIKRK